jgi:branched-chain amino acid transport system ATP-binding protein
MNPYDIAKLGISYCMEEDNVFPYMTVRENLLSGAHRNRDAVDARLASVYDLFPILDERTEQRANTLSGGQRQMLAIGIGLMSEPDLLVLDEPTLGLAPVVIDDIAEVIDRLREQEFSVLLVEQNVTFGFEHANEVILMRPARSSRVGRQTNSARTTTSARPFWGCLRRRANRQSLVLDPPLPLR